MYTLVMHCDSPETIYVHVDFRAMWPLFQLHLVENSPVLWESVNHCVLLCALSLGAGHCQIAKYLQCNLIRLQWYRLVSNHEAK